MSFTFAHMSSSLTLKITTNLNSAGTDESWGIQKIDVSLIFEDIDFGESLDLCNRYAADGWKDENDATVACTTCGSSFGSILGGYNTLAAGSSVQKEFTNLYAHISVTVDLDFVKIDSWDNELFYVYADDVLVYTSDTISKSTGTQECGSTANNWNEFVISVSFTFAHSSSSLTLKITTNLNSAGTDESWGIQKIDVSLISRISSIPLSRSLRTRTPPCQ